MGHMVRTTSVLVPVIAISASGTMSEGDPIAVSRKAEGTRSLQGSPKVLELHAEPHWPYRAHRRSMSLEVSVPTALTDSPQPWRDTPVKGTLPGELADDSRLFSVGDERVAAALGRPVKGLRLRCFASWSRSLFTAGRRRNRSWKRLPSQLGCLMRRSGSSPLQLLFCWVVICCLKAVIGGRVFAS